MRRPRVLLNKKTAAAQKKLFAKLTKIGPNLKQISEKIGCSHSALYGASNLDRVLSPFDVVKLCAYVGGHVMPHDLRPDIFTKELIELYAAYIDSVRVYGQTI